MTSFARVAWIGQEDELHFVLCCPMLKTFKGTGNFFRWSLPVSKAFSYFAHETQDWNYRQKFVSAFAQSLWVAQRWKLPTKIHLLPVCRFTCSFSQFVVWYVVYFWIPLWFWGFGFCMFHCPFRKRQKPTCLLMYCWTADIHDNYLLERRNLNFLPVFCLSFCFSRSKYYFAVIVV